MTGTDVINEALLLCKRITPGQTPSGDELATSELALNYLIDEFNGQGIAVYSVAPIVFALSSGVGGYTIGTGGTINVPRPTRIEAWKVITSSGQTNGGKPMEAAEFVEISRDHSALGARVKALNYDQAYPLASVHLYPLPLGGMLELWVWSQLPQITNWTAALAYPPAYLHALVFNLALALAGKFATRATLDPEVKAQAQVSLAALVSSNAHQHPQDAPPEPARPQK